MTVVEEAERNYSDAVAGGHYDLYQGGLSGKHDNVRTYWEDQIRSLRLRPHLQSMVKRKRRAGEKLRIADMGAGTGEGLRLLTEIKQGDVDLHLEQKVILPFEMIEEYVGCDICAAMVQQGNVNFVDRENVRFAWGDFSQGFPLRDEKPFDLYFCTYGSYSHIDEKALKRLLSEIVEHAPDRAIMVGDWLGRHSIEWPCYWDLDGSVMKDYSMSWLPDCLGADGNPECFPMRYWTGPEVQRLLSGVATETGVWGRILDMFDISLFVGRHVDTREYNEWVQPLRSIVNRLHEENVRTDLEQLRVHLCPVDGHQEIYGPLASLAFSWNSLVDYCQRRLEKRAPPFQLKNWRQFPPPVQLAMITLDRIVDAAHWLQMGDPRANVVEPQLGYALRNLEMEFQNGSGCGHSVVGIFEIRKTQR